MPTRCQLLSRPLTVGISILVASTVTASCHGKLRFADNATTKAQLSAEPPPLQLAGKLDLASLLDLASATSGISIDYDPDVLKGQSLTVRAGKPVTQDQLWAMIHRALAQRNLSLICPPQAAGVRGGEAPLLALCKTEDASKHARTETVIDVASATGTPLTRAAIIIQPIRLAHITAADALRLLKARSRVVATQAGDDPRMLTLTDQIARIDEALAVLRAADVPAAAVIIEPYAPAHQSAADMLAKLGSLRGTGTSARQAVDAALGAATPSGELALAPGGTTLLIIAPRGEQPAWRKLLSTLDAPDALTTITYTPRGTSAADAAALVARSLDLPISPKDTPPDQPSFQPTPASAPTALPTTPAVRPDESTGSVTLTATARQHATAKALLDTLAEDPANARPMRALPVRNRPVGELVGTLERLVAAGAIGAPALDSRPLRPNSPNYVPLSGSQIPLVPGQSAGVESRSTFPLAPRGPLLKAGERDLTITADEPTSSIIALGDPRQLDQLAALLKTLDVRQPQVMLEAIIVTLSDSDSLSLGVELERLRIDGDIRSRLSSLFGLSTPTNIGGQSTRDAGQASGFTGVLLDPGDFALVVRAVQSISDGRTLSLPRVLVTSNQEASFNSVVQQPFAASFTAGNASTPTTSFGGTQDAGTQLSIRPQVGEGETLLLEYSISISSFVGAAASSSLPPPRQVTSVQSQAIVPDGFSVVVGGLEVTSEGTSVSQIPVIGDVPLLGELFKSRTKGASRSRFFVFIRASVLRDDGLTALRDASNRNATEAGLPKLSPSSWPIGSAPGSGSTEDSH